MAGTFTHSDMRTGPAVVYFGGVCVGTTIGDVEFTPELKERVRNSARFGETPIDFVHTGENYAIKVKLAENSIANLAVVLREGATVSAARYFGRVPGGLASAHAARLLVRPVDMDASDDDSEDIVFHKAVAGSPEPIAFNLNDERVFGITFTALVDDTKDDGKKLGYICGQA